MAVTYQLIYVFMDVKSFKCLLLHTARIISCLTPSYPGV